ncbi:MAG: YfjI family protein [Acetobacterium sp.]
MNKDDYEALMEINAEKNHLGKGGSGKTGNDSINSLPNSTTYDEEKQDEFKQKPHEWEMPKPLEKEHILPPFPLECLPENIRQYVKAVAISTATPVDMAAVAALAVVAGCVQKKYRIKGKPDWFEPLNLYTIIIADPGERKSSVMREMTRYVQDYEREVNLQRQENIDGQEIELNSKNKMVKKLEDQGEIEQAIEIKKECRELEATQIRPLRLIADDVTPEALTTLLAENNGALSIISAEGGIFGTLAGRYSNTVCIDTVLKAHPGDDINVDRKGRPPEYIRSPALTMLLSVQNDVIRGLFENGTFKGRGLNARFLYSKPTSTIGARSFETKPIPIETKISYKKLLYELLDIPFSSEGIPKTITLNKEAYSMLKSYFECIEVELIDSLEDMRDFGGKLVGAALRIAGVLHAMDYEKLINDEPVDRKTMVDAITIAGYFLDHSKAAYQLMGVDEDAQQLKFVLKKLEQKPQEEYKKHDIYKMCRNARIEVVSDIEPTLITLIDYGYLYEILPENVDRPGRKPATIYKLNPLYFKF